jgi:hypothetical protein
VISGEATSTNFIVFRLTQPDLEPTIYHIRGEHEPLHPRFCLKENKSRVSFLYFKDENEDIDNEAKSRNKMKSLNNLKLTDIKGKIINAKDVKVKIIQKCLIKKSLPKCQDKWYNSILFF